LDSSSVIQKIDDELRGLILLIGAGSSSEEDARRFDEAFRDLRDWVDGSLDLYKRELHAVLYPVLIHCFLELIRLDVPTQAREMLIQRGAEFRDDIGNAPSRRAEMLSLAGISSKEHLQENETAQMFLKNRYEVHLTHFAYELLVSFLTGDSNRLPLLRILNERCKIEIIALSTARAETRAGFAMNDQPHSSHTVLWGRLRREELVVGEGLEARQQEKEKERDTGHPEILTDGLLSKAAIPLPRFREHSHNAKSLSGVDAPPPVEEVNGENPSALFYTVTNEAGAHVNAIAMSPDASIVVGAFADSVLRSWDCRNGGKPMYTLVGHTGPIFAVDLSFCGKFLVSGSEDGTARLWSVVPGLETDIVAFRGHNYPVWACEFGPFGHYLATGSHDRTARIWSTERAHPLRILAGHLADVDSVKWHPNCTYLATGSSDRTARLWDIRSGDCVRVFESMGASVHTLAFSPSGKHLAIGDGLGDIDVVDIGSGRAIHRLGRHDGGVWSVDFAPGSDLMVASGGGDFSVRVWNLAKDQRGVRRSDLTGISSQSATKSYKTSRIAVYKVMYTRKNLLVGCGAMLPS